MESSSSTKKNLPECAQILYRVLFEVYLKNKEFMRTAEKEGKENALGKLLDSLIFESEKRSAAQNIHSIRPEGLEGRYDEKTIKDMKKYGFVSMQIEELAKQHNKINLYHILYHNFSRNVHANDMQEYMLKITHELNNQQSIYLQQRDIIALNEAFKISLEMVGIMNFFFERCIDDDLDNIRKKYFYLNI